MKVLTSLRYVDKIVEELFYSGFRPTNIPLCLNGGYINEASEAEARTRESNREPPAPPRRLITSDNVTDNNTASLVSTDSLDVDFRKCNNIKNW